MRLPNRFSGRIVQVTEALSYQDAVSDQVVNLHACLLALGLRSEVYTKFHDPRLEQHRKPIEEMRLSDRDIAILHFYGRSDHALPMVIQSYCTRILLYHNITPADFFQENSRLHEFCKTGREQLRSSVHLFHRIWAVSNFNLKELLELGVNFSNSSIVPIVVPEPDLSVQPAKRDVGTWLFIGRIAPNKRQVDLVRLFAEAHEKRPGLAKRLILAGGFELDDHYYLDLKKAIISLGLCQSVRVAGKISNEERDDLYRTASVYVSLSEHEGFGVPLIEASLRGLPVVAFDAAAVGETLGHSAGVVSTQVEVLRTIFRLSEDPTFRELVTTQQRNNARRFCWGAVSHAIAQALSNVLPLKKPFRTVSVIICTYNRKNYLERLLEYLCYQRSNAFEVIVVDGPSDDGSKELLAQHLNELKVAHNPTKNLAKSRNLGIELADGDVVAFIDDDALPFDDWVVRLLDAYNSRPLTTAGLGGPVYYAGTFWFQAQDNGINRLGEAKINIESGEIGANGWFRYNTGTNASFSTGLLRECGGFDEQFDYYLDESEVCYRLQQNGALIGYEPDVVVRHEFAQSHNRQGRLNYNWYTICKNTAYFIAAYSGYSGDALKSYIDERMYRDRIEVFENSRRNSEISDEELIRYRNAVLEGAAQGLIDAQYYPRRRVLREAPGRFQPYPVLPRPPLSPPARERMHICIISREFPPFVAGGGVGTLYYHLASELLMMGHRVTAIVPGESSHIFDQGNIRVHFTPTTPVHLLEGDEGFGRNLSWSASALKQLASVHADDPVDIVDSALWDTEALATALLPVGSRPYVVVRLVTPYAIASSINDWNPSPQTKSLFMAAERALISHADAVVPISESIAESIEHLYGVHRDQRWKTIPCGIAYWPFFDVNQGYNEFPQLERLPRQVIESGKMILFIGRLERRKGVDLILEAAPSMLRSTPDAHLVLAGRDVEGWGGRPLPDHLAGRVHFLGEVDNATREKLLARAWCVLFPSRYESFGLVPLEAFVHGVPVVAARAGAIPEVVEDGISGLLFENGLSESLALAVAKLLTNPILHRRLSVGATARVRALSSRVSASRTVNLYHHLIY